MGEQLSDPLTFIPTSALEADQRQTDASAWADTQRANVAQIWADSQRAQADALASDMAQPQYPVQVGMGDVQRLGQPEPSTQPVSEPPAPAQDPMASIGDLMGNAGAAIGDTLGNAGQAIGGGIQAVRDAIPTTVDLGVNPQRAAPTGNEGSLLQRIGEIATQYGLDPLVAKAIAITEGGLSGSVGDNKQSFGPFQFYKDQGQLPAFAALLGVDQDTAGKIAQANPEFAADWALRPGGYLGDAIRRGAEKGLSGATLATYAQHPGQDPGGQRSVSPERAGQNYDRLVGMGDVQRAGQPDQAPDQFPVVGYTGTDVPLHWGSNAGGTDLFAAEGTPVVAMRGGKVISSSTDSIGGNAVLIQGDDGNQYYYAHLYQTPAVKAGQTVAAGDYLGGVGDTGNAKGTGAHLHMGIGPSIVNGSGPAGGTGGDFNAVGLLQNTLAQAGKVGGDILGNAGAAIGAQLGAQGEAIGNIVSKVGEVGGAVGQGVLDVATSNPYTPFSQVVKQTTGLGQGIPTDEEAIAQVQDDLGFQALVSHGVPAAEAAHQTLASQMYAMAMADAPLGKAGAIGKAGTEVGGAAKAAEGAAVKPTSGLVDAAGRPLDMPPAPAQILGPAGEVLPPSVAAGMQGTAEQAAQLRPPEPGYAGNIKLDKFPEEVRPLIQQTMDESNQFAGQRRGVITDAQALDNASSVAENTSVEQWLKTRPGKAFNQEEALALGQTLTKVGKDYDGLLTTVTDARTAGTSTLDLEAQLAQKALEMGTLAGVRSGSAAEAGRVLRSFKQELTGENASRSDAINRAFKALGGTTQFSKWVEEYSKIPVTDKAAQYKMFQSLTTPTIWDKLSAWRYASMLSSWKTHEANISGNVGQSLYRPLETAAAGHPGVAVQDLRGMLQGIPDGIAAAADTLGNGVRSDQLDKLGNIKPRPFGNGPVGRAISFPSDMLAAADDFFKAVNTSGSLRAQAARMTSDPAKIQELMRNPTSKMVSEANDAALRGTYQEDPGAFVNWLGKGRTLPGAQGQAFSFVLPFIRTPANIFHRGVGLTLQPLTGIPKTAVKLAKGDMEGARTEAAKTLLASTFAAGFAAKAVNGEMSGMGPSDAAQRQALEATGWQQHSIKVGDRWIDYTNMGPISVQMATIAAMYEGYQDSKKVNQDLAKDVVNRVASTLADTSYIQGIGNLFKMTQGNPQTAAFNLGTGIASSFVPYGSGIAAVERISDPTTTARNDVGQVIMGRIPVLSKMVPTEPDVFGKTKQTSTDTYLASIVLPWKSSLQRPDAVAEEVARLNQAGQPVHVRAFTDQYAGAKQTPEQGRQLQSTAGTAAAAYIADFMAKPDYQGLTDKQKATTLNAALGTAYEATDIQLGDTVARSPEQQALVAWANIPHFEGVKGTAEQIRQKNFEIAQAKAKLSDYKQRYGVDAGEYQLLKQDQQGWKLSQSAALDSDYLAAKKKAVDKLFGGALSTAEKQGLVGAGNTVIPVGSGR